jgi:hypothetical protein
MLTIVLRLILVLQLVQRRHRLDESKIVVRRRYQGWRKRQKQRAANQRLALLQGREAEPLVDPEEEAMTNQDILAVYQVC